MNLSWCLIDGYSRNCIQEHPMPHYQSRPVKYCIKPRTGGMEGLLMVRPEDIELILTTCDLFGVPEG